MRTATVSARSISTRWRGRGPCYAPGCGHTAASRRRSCRCISAFSSSCTTPGAGEKPSLAPSSRLWSCDVPPSPRNPIRAKADCWLPVRPGTDAALALALAGIMIDEGWFDAEFVREWTNGPFLVHEDSGQMLRGDALEAGAHGFVAWAEVQGRPVAYDMDVRAFERQPLRLALAGGFPGAGRDGTIVCPPGFD